MLMTHIKTTVNEKSIFQANKRIHQNYWNLHGQLSYLINWNDQPMITRNTSTVCSVLYQNLIENKDHKTMFNIVYVHKVSATTEKNI